MDNAETIAAGKWELLLQDMQREFPRMRIIRKSESTFQKLIHYTLIGVTFGQMRSYLSDYQTTIGQRMYVTDSWEAKSACTRYVTMRHEREHMRQFRRYSFIGMSLLYLTVPLPAGLAWFRAKFERDAYAESIRAAAEIHGVDYVASGEFREHIIRQFTGPSYGWMWPFRARIERWYDRVVSGVRRTL